MDKKGGIKIFRRIFYVSQCQKLLLGKVLVFHYYRVSRNFVDKRGYKNSPVDLFVSHSAEEVCRECFSVSFFLLSRNFKDKRGYKDFRSNFLCLSVPKNFIGESFTVSLNSGVKKFYG